MKICVVSRACPALAGGINGIFEYDQARALSKLGNEVFFISIDERSIRRKRRLGFQIIHKDGLTILNYAIPLGRLPVPILNWVGYFCFKKAYKYLITHYGKIDIVHAHFGEITGYYCLKGSKKFGFKYVITEHSSFKYPKDVSPFVKKRLMKVYSNASDLITVSNFYRRKLSETYGLPFKYIPNIVDSSSFSNIAHKKRDPCTFHFVSTGRLSEPKGFSELISAFYLAHDSLPFIDLKIIGDGAYKTELTKMIDFYKANGYIKLLGYLPRSEINRVYAGSDCFILTSRWESFGVAFIEAMLAGLPAIGTRCGGPESIINRSNGILVNVGDVDEISKAIIGMVRDYKKYDRNLISEGIRLKYSDSVVGKQIERVLRDASNKETV